MRLDDNTPASRIARISLIVAGVALALLGFYVGPDLFELIQTGFIILIPYQVRGPLRVATTIGFWTAIAAYLSTRPRRIWKVPISPRLWEHLDTWGEWLISGGLGVGLFLVSGLMLLFWVPHYLIWPWWADTEYFAISAFSWQHGILPYRDLFDFNFPGPTYLHWILGECFGWGRTVPYNAVDAAGLVVLGAVMAWWSHKRFDSLIPGGIGFLAVLGYYLSLDYALVGQRDWHAPLLCVLAILILEARPGWISIVLAGLLYAASLTIRPHPVVLLPAMLSAIDECARREGESWIKTIRAAIAWSAVVGLGMLAGTAPLLIQGNLGDFLYWFQRAWYDGRYNQTAKRSVLGEVLRQLTRVKTEIVLGALILLEFTDVERRRFVRTWFLALIFVLFYRPLSPVLHDYLYHPSILIWSITAGIVGMLILNARRLIPIARVMLILLLLGFWVPGWPIYSRPINALEGARCLISRVPPSAPPPGCRVKLPARPEKGSYGWSEYVSVIDYLKRHTDDQTFVANFIRRHPFPALNGPAGRLTPFPSPGGILWLRMAAPDQVALFAEALARPTRAVVVWEPTVEREYLDLPLPELEAVVRRDFEFEANFGVIELWRRREGRERPPPVSPDS